MRKPERNAERFRLPDDESVRENALGVDLGRALLAIRIEDCREHDRPRPYRCGMRLQPLALQVRERRDEVEVPVGDHREGSWARRSAIAAHTARRAASSSAPHAAISSSVRAQPTQSPVDGSMRQTLMQGEGTDAVDSFTRLPRSEPQSPGLAKPPRQPYPATGSALASSARATRDMLERCR